MLAAGGGRQRAALARRIEAEQGEKRETRQRRRTGGKSFSFLYTGLSGER